MTTEMPVADRTYSIPPESVTGPAGAVYQKQLAFERARRSYEFELASAQSAHEDAQRAAAARGGFGPLTQPWDQPSVRQARKVMEHERTIMEMAQQEIGGVIMCVETGANLPKAIKRMESLSRRAVKLGLDPITLKVTDETVVLEYAYADDGERGYTDTFLHTYCILSGGTPKVEGFHFLATIEHTPAGNIVKKVPPLGAMMRGLTSAVSEHEAAEALEAIDVEDYRHVGPDCDHCGLIRSRKDTYLVYNDETGEIKHVGRTCLRDYTGADNPEAIVKFLEHYFESMRSNNTERPKPVIKTRDFLTNVAAAGLPYVKWESKEDALRNYFLVKEVEALQAANKPVPSDWVYTIPTEHHYHTADEMIRWACETWTDTGDYATNVKIALANEIVPERAYGIAASVFVAKDRWDGREAERKAEAEQPVSEFVGQVGERIEFTATVTQKSYRGESDYGKDLYNIKLHDENGNELFWSRTSSALRVKGESDDPFVTEGKTYRVKATIDGHNDHPRFGKSTYINRAEFLYEIKEKGA